MDITGKAVHKRLTTEDFMHLEQIKFMFPGKWKYSPSFFLLIIYLEH